MAPMGPGGMSDDNGAFNQRGIDYYVERAKGGTGLLITGTIKVENDIEKMVLPHTPFPTYNPECFIRSGKELTDRVHAYNSKIFAQLTGGFGRVMIPHLMQKGADMVGPSMNPNRWDNTIYTREITTKEVKQLVKKMGEAAKVCKHAGFDGIEIHAVHEGYLIDQFTMEIFNRRTDEYGGSFENRLRLPIEIVQEIKKTCGEDFPVIVRYTPKHFMKDYQQGALPGEEFVEKGRDMEEGIKMAQALEAAGYDAFDVDVGCYDSWYWNHPPQYFKKGLYLEFSRALKKYLKTPIITAGRMDNPDLASKSILDGSTDMIGLGRPLLADAYLPNKIQQEKIEFIRPCLSCHQGCLSRIPLFLSCAVNPTTGREAEYALKKADQVKNVLIVGGGVAGCEAARVCAERGHKVTLYEKSDRLGGNLIPGGAPDFKEDDLALVKWYETQLKALNVDVHLSSPATKEVIDSINPDTLIIATGSKPKMICFPGSDSEKVVTANDVLLKKVDPGKNVVIIGGGLVGCETALWLAQQGKEVTIVEALGDILKAGIELALPNEQMLRELLAYNKVNIITGSTVSALNQDGAVISSCAGGEQKTIPADCVIISVGYCADNKLYDEVRQGSYELYLLGDSRKVQNIMAAIWDAAQVARNI